MPLRFHWNHLCIQHSILFMFRLFRALEMFLFTLCNNFSVDLAPMEDLPHSAYLEKITSVPVNTLQNNFEKKAIKQCGTFVTM